MQRITLRLPTQTIAALNHQAVAEGRTPSDLARHLLNQSLELPTQRKLDKRQNPVLPLTDDRP
jgi:hypothetical protein